MVTGASPILAVADVVETLRFYKEVLGFDSSWTWGEPPTFGGANWGSVSFMFSLDPELAARSHGQSLWLNAENVDELHERHVKNGAEIVLPIEDKPWGRREYTVKDPNGYLLRVAGLTASTAPPSRPFPEGVRIERRLPTLDEYRQVAGEAFYSGKASQDTLARTWQAVVAVSPEGDAIGTVRIVCDAPGWFSIWDVAVLPAWQGQRIGERLMKEALEIVGEESPGAWVFLFTYKHGFYERLGFGKESVCMRRV
jgi:ribosomal protein S18 acetylase RimI-like enzyme